MHFCTIPSTTQMALYRTGRSGAPTTADVIDAKVYLCNLMKQTRVSVNKLLSSGNTHVATHCLVCHLGELHPK